MTTIWPVDEPEPLPLDAAPLAALEPLPPLPPPPSRIPSRSPVGPSVRSTEATVPAIVEVKDASLRLVCAVDRRTPPTSPTLRPSRSSWSRHRPLRRCARRSWAAVSWAWAAATPPTGPWCRPWPAPARRSPFWPALTFDAGHGARDGEVQTGLAGRFERPRTGHGLLDGAGRGTARWPSSRSTPSRASSWRSARASDPTAPPIRTTAGPRWASGTGARPTAAPRPGRSRRRAAIPRSDPLGSPAPRPLPFSP